MHFGNPRLKAGVVKYDQNTKENNAVFCEDSQRVSKDSTDFLWFIEEFTRKITDLKVAYT